MLDLLGGRLVVICRITASRDRLLRETDNDPSPFVWTVDPDKIIAAVRRHQAFDSIVLVVKIRRGTERWLG